MHLLLLLACEAMESSGRPFAPVPAAAPPPVVTPVAAPAAAPATEAGTAPAPAAKTGDPDWSFPVSPPEVISSEELQKKEEGAPATDLFGNPIASAAPAPTGTRIEAPVAPLLAISNLPADPWPVRLVATLPMAQPPRAVIGLANGDEKVVSPGSILAEQGIVVLSVSSDRVQLAKIEAAGDHARISSIELSAAYPTGSR
jgi:hypothetical protein